MGIPTCAVPGFLQVFSPVWEDLQDLIKTFPCISGICYLSKVVASQQIVEIAEPHHIQLPLSQAAGG